MARGGYRPGAGRKPKRSQQDSAPKVPADIVRAAAKKKQTPLAYMLDVMNDDASAKERRDRMAIAAAPFVHARPADAKPGKKDQQAAKAAAVARGRFAPPAPPKLVIDNK